MKRGDAVKFLQDFKSYNHDLNYKVHNHMDRNIKYNLLIILSMLMLNVILYYHIHLRITLMPAATEGEVEYPFI